MATTTTAPTSEPKILEPEERETEVSAGGMLQLDRIDVDQQVATAKAHPRVLSDVRALAYQLITQDKDAATDCYYALPRGKEKNAQGQWIQKIVKGPTARFAEIMFHSWGNARASARVTEVQDRVIVALGYCYDLQQNVAIAFEVRRRIVDSEGKRYNDDMILNTGNAACSIALRNAVLKVIPKPFWKGLLQSAEEIVMGDRTTLVDRRQKVFDQFKVYRITPAMACELAGAAGTADVGQEQLVVLQGMLTALKDGDVTVETLLGQLESSKVAEKSKRPIDQVKAKYSKKVDKSEVEQAQAKLEEQRKAQSKGDFEPLVDKPEEPF